LGQRSVLTIIVEYTGRGFPHQTHASLMGKTKTAGCHLAGFPKVSEIRFQSCDTEGAIN